MTLQNPQEVRVLDPILTDYAHGYVHPERVGNYLFPPVPVSVSGGQVLQFGKESFRKYNYRRAPGGAKKRLSYGYKGAPYALSQDAFEVPVPYENMRDASVIPGLDLGKGATMFAMDSGSLQLEIEQADLAQDATRYATSNKIVLAGASKFSDPSANVPQQMDQYKEVIRAAIGAYPNVAIAGPRAHNVTKNNPSVLNRYIYRDRPEDSVTEAMLASLFDLDRYIVGKAIWFDDFGVSNDIWGNNIILAYIPPEVLTQELITYAPSGLITNIRPSYGYTYTMKDKGTNHPIIEAPYDDRTCDSWIYPYKYERTPILAGVEQDGVEAGKAIAGFLIQNVA
jgi:hypothetical protein